jgi:eukaryotic-like serine/threonine-protein kinase
VIGALVPVVAMPTTGIAWPLAAAAPALGALGLAGAWPAVAARAITAWRRAALGMTGWAWLTLAGPVAGTGLYLRAAPGTPAPAVWTGSLQGAVHDVLGPLVSSGALAGAPVWALGAVVLPWLVRGRSPALDCARVAMWAAVLVSATEAAIAVVHGSRAAPALRTAVLGGVACAAVALAPTSIRTWRARRDSGSP